MASNPPPPTLDEQLDKFTREKLFEGVIAGAAKSVERARGSGQFIQGAAAAIGTLYTGVLALSFAADASTLPWRGLVPALFLASAIALAAFYTAFLTRAGGIPEPTIPGTATAESRLFHRAIWFMTWSNRASFNRVRFLRAAVVSLAIGVFLMPLPFVSFATADADVTEWPEPMYADLPVELGAIVYQAQIDEAKAQAERGVADTDDETTAIVSAALLAVGLLAVVVTLLWGLGLVAWIASAVIFIVSVVAVALFWLAVSSA